ncbi:MAG TPA: hypothetical protein VFU31_02075 [Candidatus Binatia bacterium]|nr:hypothetical protein [Candidatus Binatia bacterium]
MTVKIEIPFLAGLFLIASELWARAAVQGVEPAFASTAIEWAMKISGRLEKKPA